MNEFEWLRQMRQLKHDAAPPEDLWARIDAALDQAQTTAEQPALPQKRSARPRYLGWAIAASIVAVAVLAGSLTWQLRHSSTGQPSELASSVREKADTTPWKPTDPRLAGAATELDAARMELQQAIQQSPNSPALQRLLRQTDAQQTALRELEKRNG